MTGRAAGAVLVLAAALACGGDRSGPRPGAADSVASAPRPVVDSTMLLVARGAAVAIAVDAAPGRVDSILAAEGLSPEAYERLMYRIASDSVLSRLYQEALQGR
jgi:hypothetical protein